MYSILVKALVRILKGQESGPYEVRLQQAIVKAKIELDRELALKDKGGVSETLCMRFSPCGLDGSFIEPFWV